MKSCSLYVLLMALALVNARGFVSGLMVGVFLSGLVVEWKRGRS